MLGWPSRPLPRFTPAAPLHRLHSPWLTLGARLSAVAAFAIIATIAALAAGCAEGNEPIDPCKRALDRLVEECGFEIEGVENLEIDCQGAGECVGYCLETAACESIGQETGEFADCSAQCAQ